MTAMLNNTQPAITADTIAPIFFQQAFAKPDKEAIHFEDTCIHYGELSEAVIRWSNQLAVNGVRRGDHIGVVLPNSIAFVALMLVAADLGVALVPVNPSLPFEAIQKAFIATDVKHLISDNAHFTEWISEECSMRGFSGLTLCVDTPSLKIEDTNMGELPYGTLRLSSCFQAGYYSHLPLNWGKADDAFILTMTSGSTGDPKPIVLTQRTKINRAKAAQALYAIVPCDITLAATPLYHSLAERLVLIPLLTGGTSVLMARYSPNEWVSQVNQHRVSFTIAVSSQLRQISQVLAQPEAPQLSSLRCLVSSSALLENEVKQTLVSQLACAFHECYGASEIAIASNLDGQIRHKLKSVGVAAPTVDIVILDNENQPLPIGEAGEIACKTSMLFGGYYKRPELTQAAMWGEYFKTGDIGKLDEDGYLYYLGRKKDLIISGGINIYPMDIESILNELPEISESAAFAYSDPALGEVVAVAIVPTDSVQFEIKRAKHLCARRLADYQQPRKWFLVDSIPKNSLGKVMKYQLVNQFSQT